MHTLACTHTHIHSTFSVKCCRAASCRCLCVVAAFIHHEWLQSNLSWLDLRHQSHCVSAHCGSPVFSVATIKMKKIEGGSFSPQIGVIIELVQNIIMDQSWSRSDPTQSLTLVLLILQEFSRLSSPAACLSDLTSLVSLVSFVLSDFF